MEKFLDEARKSGFVASTIERAGACRRRCRAASATAGSLRLGRRLKAPSEAALAVATEYSGTRGFLKNWAICTVQIA